MSNLIVDDIARAMTDVEAPADLRGRVLSEISRPRSRRWPAVLFPLASAASIVAVGLFVIRPLLTAFEVPAVPRPSLFRFAAGDPAPKAFTVATPAARRWASVEPLSADELAWLSRRLPALETRALTLESIQPAVPAIAPINVEPIALEPILVPPSGAGSGDRR